MPTLYQVGLKTPTQGANAVLPTARDVRPEQAHVQRPEIDLGTERVELLYKHTTGIGGQTILDKLWHCQKALSLAAIKTITTLEKLVVYAVAEEDGRPEHGQLNTGNVIDNALGVECPLMGFLEESGQQVRGWRRWLGSAGL